MTFRKAPTSPFSDIEKPHETVADSFGDGVGAGAADGSAGGFVE